MIICAAQTLAGRKLVEVSREFLPGKDMNGLVSEARNLSGANFAAHRQECRQEQSRLSNGRMRRKSCYRNSSLQGQFSRDSRDKERKL